MAALVDLAGLQLDALTLQPADAGTYEGLEESLYAVDAVGSLVRAERHQAAIARVGGVIAPPRLGRDGAPVDRAAYGKYVAQCVDAMGFANISGVEVLGVHARVTRSGVKNRLPNPWGLYRLLCLLAYDQRARDLLGVALRFNSIHRSGPYNAAIGGASRSAHRACTARDRVPIGATVRELWRVDRKLRGDRVHLTTAQARVLRAVANDYTLSAPFTESVFREPFHAAGLGFRQSADAASYTHSGGLGLYGGFVHADARGRAADWRG